LIFSGAGDSSIVSVGFAAVTAGPEAGRTGGMGVIDKASGVTGCRFYELRRTARTLLSRAGVDAETAERCLGHAIGGVCDQHKYD
jgi:integrase